MNKSSSRFSWIVPVVPQSNKIRFLQSNACVFRFVLILLTEQTSFGLTFYLKNSKCLWTACSPSKLYFWGLDFTAYKRKTRITTNKEGLHKTFISLLWKKFRMQGSHNSSTKLPRTWFLPPYYPPSPHVPKELLEFQPSLLGSGMEEGERSHAPL